MKNTATVCTDILHSEVLHVDCVTGNQQRLCCIMACS